MTHAPRVAGEWIDRMPPGDAEFVIRPRTQSSLRVLANRLLSCHPHNFVVIAEGPSGKMLVCSKSAVDCLTKADTVETKVDSETAGRAMPGVQPHPPASECHLDACTYPHPHSHGTGTPKAGT